MNPIILTLTFLFSTACTTNANAYPKQSSGLWINSLEEHVLHAISSNTTLGLAPNASSLLNSSDITIICRTEPPPRQPITMAEYYEAVQQILIRDDALLSRRFDLEPGSGRSFSWRGGQCAIGFLNDQPLRTDAFPIILVAHVAALIATECITEEEGYLGGVARIGLNRGIVGVIHVVEPSTESGEKDEGAPSAAE